MKTPIILLIITLSFGLGLKAQNTWTPQNSGLSTTLISVHFNDDQNGWAVGVNGEIVSTTNGGLEWTPQNSGVNMTLNQVFFVDNSIGWIAGQNGILKTTNGGNTWNTVFTPEEYHDLNTIHFTDQNTGWAAGGDLSEAFLLKTLDGGSSWIEYSDSVNYWSPWVNGTDGSIQDILFLNEDVGWFIGTDATSAASWMTTDGGSTWEEMFFGITCPKYGLDFIDSQNGWTAGKHSFRSTDNGDDWYIKDTGFDDSYAFDVDFVTHSIGWIIGDEGKIAMSTDSGNNWNAQTSGTTSRLYGIHMFDENLGWIVGRDGTILKYSPNNTTSIFTTSESERFNIFPNPVNNQLNIDSEIGINEVNILDVTGKLIKNVEYHPRQIKVSDLPNGVYFIELISTKYSSIQKFVKE